MCWHIKLQAHPTPELGTPVSPGTSWSLLSGVFYTCSAAACQVSRRMQLTSFGHRMQADLHAVVL